MMIQLNTAAHRFVSFHLFFAQMVNGLLMYEKTVQLIFIWSSLSLLLYLVNLYNTKFDQSTSFCQFELNLCLSCCFNFGFNLAIALSTVCIFLMKHPCDLCVSVLCIFGISAHRMWSTVQHWPIEQLLLLICHACIFATYSFDWFLGVKINWLSHWICARISNCSAVPNWRRARQPRLKGAPTFRNLLQIAPIFCQAEDIFFVFSFGGIRKNLLSNFKKRLCQIVMCNLSSGPPHGFYRYLKPNNLYYLSRSIFQFHYYALPHSFVVCNSQFICCYFLHFILICRLLRLVHWPSFAFSLRLHHVHICSCKTGFNAMRMSFINCNYNFFLCLIIGHYLCSCNFLILRNENLLKNIKKSSLKCCIDLCIQFKKKIRF